MVNDNFRTVQDVVLPENQLLFVNGADEESILLHDSGPDDNQRIFLFSNNQLKGIARASTHFQMDGTFSKAPKIYNDGIANHGQLLTIQAKHNGILIPVFYILMKSKTVTQYERVFDILSGLELFAPTSIMSDLETALMSAIQRKFDCTHSLCYYHFQESLYSWIQSHQMQMRYNNDDAFRKFIHKFGVLAFLPVNLVLNGWQALNALYRQNFRDDFDVRDFVNYFASSFIGLPTEDGGRDQPRYPINKWNQFDNTMNQNPRTNNAVEGWHNALNHICTHNHPKFFKFLSMIKTDMSRSRVLQVQANPIPRRRFYQNLDSNIQRLCAGLNPGMNRERILQFLESAANMFHFYV